MTPHAVVAAAEAGVKGIFAEKPIAARLADADAMVEACRQRGIPFACGAVWRNHPSLREAARLIHEENAIGRVLSVNVLGTNEEVSGVGCHYFNVVRLLARSEIDSTIGWTLGDPFSDHDQGGGRLLHFANGIEAFVHARAGTKSGVQVLGEWGVFFWDWADVYLWRNQSTWSLPWDLRLRDFSRLQRIPFPYPKLAYPDIYPGITGGLQSLIDAIEHRGEPYTSGDDIRRVLEVAIASVSSARRGRIPVDLPLADRNLAIIPRPERWGRRQTPRNRLISLSLREGMRDGGGRDARSVVGAGRRYLAFQESQVALLRERVGLLEGELPKLRIYLAEVQAYSKQHSGISFRPPSSDPPDAPARPTSKPSGRNRGGQKGHVGHTRVYLRSAQIGETLRHRTTQCPSCTLPLEAGCRPKATPSASAPGRFRRRLLQ